MLEVDKLRFYVVYFFSHISNKLIKCGLASFLKMLVWFEGELAVVSSRFTRHKEVPPNIHLAFGTGVKQDTTGNRN